MLDIEIGGRLVTLAISIDQLKRQGHPNENDIYLRQIDAFMIAYSVTGMESALSLYLCYIRRDIL